MVGNEAEQGELSAAILAAPWQYVTDRYGQARLEALLARTGVPAARACERSTWLAHAEFEALVAALRAEVGSDEEFLTACGYRVAEAYGPLVEVMRATSPERLYRLLARTLYVVSRVSRFDAAELGARRMWIRYTSSLRESRLMCLSRIAQLRALPTAFGLSAGEVEERQCKGKGDPCCDYEVSWQEKPRTRRSTRLEEAR